MDNDYLETFKEIHWDIFIFFVNFIEFASTDLNHSQQTLGRTNHIEYAYREKTIADKLIYTSNGDGQNYPLLITWIICRKVASLNQAFNQELAVLKVLDTSLIQSPLPRLYLVKMQRKLE